METVKTISSRQNPLVVAIGKLNDKKHRDREGRFRFDGFKLFAEALQAGLPVEYVFFLPRMRERVLAALNGPGVAFGGEAIEVSEGVFDKLSDEKSPDGVICVSKYIDKLHKVATINNIIPCFVKENPSARVLVLESVRDAGNVGTILRCASAFGVDGVVLSSDCADIYNPKTVRAAMGALFRLPVWVTPDVGETVQALRQMGRRVWATALDRDAVQLGSFSLSPTDCFVIGNEGHGLTDSLKGACTGSVFIPIAPHSESLNAAIAASLCLWELSKTSREG